MLEGIYKLFTPSSESLAQAPETAMPNSDAKETFLVADGKMRLEQRLDREMKEVEEKLLNNPDKCLDTFKLVDCSEFFTRERYDVIVKIAIEVQIILFMKMYELICKAYKARLQYCKTQEAERIKQAREALDKMYKQARKSLDEDKLCWEEKVRQNKGFCEEYQTSLNKVEMAKFPEEKTIEIVEEFKAYYGKVWLPKFRGRVVAELHEFNNDKMDDLYLSNLKGTFRTTQAKTVEEMRFQEKLEEFLQNVDSSLDLQDVLSDPTVQRLISTWKKMITTSTLEEVCKRVLLDDFILPHLSEEVQAKQDKDKLLATIDQYFSLHGEKTFRWFIRTIKQEIVNNGSELPPSSHKKQRIN